MMAALATTSEGIVWTKTPLTYHTLQPRPIYPSHYNPQSRLYGEYQDAMHALTAQLSGQFHPLHLQNQPRGPTINAEQWVEWVWFSIRQGIVENGPYRLVYAEEMANPARPDLFKECGKLEIEDIEWKLHDSKKSLDFPVMTNTEVHRLQNLVKDGRIRVVWKDPGADEDSDAEA